MSVYLEKNDREELILENATLLEVNNKGATVTTLFEEPKTVMKAQVKKIDFLAGTVILTTKLED